MMRCPRCKAKVTDNSAFCSACGCELSSKKQQKNLVIIIIVLIVVLALGLGVFGKLLFDKRKEEAAELARRQRLERYEQQQNDNSISIERMDGEIVEGMDVKEYLEYGNNDKFNDSTSKDTKDNDIGKTSEYVIEDSASRYLTDADVKGLTLQEINYAKNEIYARHGRRFNSKELQDYFDSTSWYVGKYSPEDFDQNYSSKMLNDYEKKNAEFLRDKEFAINPNGYQLDAK